MSDTVSNCYSYSTLPPFSEHCVHWYSSTISKSSSAMAERPLELGDFKGMGHFEAKF